MRNDVIVTSEILLIENTNISHQNNVDRGRDCEVRRAAEFDIEIKSDWLLMFSLS